MIQVCYKPKLLSVTAFEYQMDLSSNAKSFNITSTQVEEYEKKKKLQCTHLGNLQFKPNKHAPGL